MDNLLPRRPRVKLFRGEYALVWERRLLAAGWPAEAARRLSQFLTGDASMPRWPELVNQTPQEMR